MLWALVSVAAAGVLDLTAFGARVGLHPSGDIAAGPTLFSLDGDGTFYVLFGPETETLPVVRSWGLAIGGWTPMFLSDAKEREAYQKSLRNVKPGEAPPPPPKEGLFDGAPLVEIGGSAWDAERFFANIGGTGLLNLGHIAKLASTTAYFGPSFGGVTRVRYLQSAAAGEGAILLDLGLDAGARAGQAALFRLHTAAELDPFVGDLALLGDVIVGVSLNAVEVPLVIQLRGQGSLDPAREWAPTGTASVSVGYASD